MIPLYSTSQVREADLFAINELCIPGIVLMENASISILNFLEEKLSESPEAFIGTIGIVCGKGNNGGDGFALGRQMANKGYDVLVCSLEEENVFKGDALVNYRSCRKYHDEGYLQMLKIETADELSVLADCSIIVDAIFGTGIKGDVSGETAEIIKKLNQFSAFKVAVDLPSGLAGDTGRGNPVFNADFTITLANYKPGLFFGKGYTNCGDIALGAIGMHDEYFRALETDIFLLEDEDAYKGLPEKSLVSYKYSAGKVFVIAGSGKYPGAAKMCVNSAFRSGAGAVLHAFPRSIKELLLTEITPAVMAPYVDNTKEYFSVNNYEEVLNNIEWCDTLAIGPGLGRHQETVAGVRKILTDHPEKNIVIDADALYALNNHEWKNYDLAGKILTPHHKEFSDLIGIEVDELEKSVLDYGRKFAMESESFLVLKGAPTIIFLPDGKAVINSVGNNGMAKFGTGDLLTGIIAGFCAQSNDIESALLSAVYIHSDAADLLREDTDVYTMLSEDILNYYSDSIKNLVEKFA